MYCNVTVAGMRSQVVLRYCWACRMNPARISWGTASQSARSRIVGYGCHCAAGSRAAASADSLSPLVSRFLGPWPAARVAPSATRVGIVFIRPLQIAPLQLLHRVVAGTRGQRHVGDRRIHARRAGHARPVGHEQVGDVVRLVVAVQHRGLRVAPHARGAHLMDREPGLAAAAPPSLATGAALIAEAAHVVAAT